MNSHATFPIQWKISVTQHTKHAYKPATRKRSPSSSNFPKNKSEFNNFVMALSSPYSSLWVDPDTSLWDTLEDHPFFNLNSSFFREANIGRDNRANVSELENEYKVEVEVPGYQKAELDIEFSTDGTSVTISGRHESSYEEEGPVEESKEPEKSKEKEEKKQKKHSRWRSRRSKQRAVGKTVPKYWVSERSEGEFSRTFTFQRAVDPAKAVAHLESGVLTITIPKGAGPQVQKITIE